MCTKEETAEIIKTEFFKEGGLKDALVKDVERAIDARVGRWLLGGGIIFLFTISAAWFSLKAQVDDNTEKIENALTSDQAALVIQRLDQLEQSVREKNTTIEKLDDRLRAKGI